MPRSFCVWGTQCTEGKFAAEQLEPPFLVRAKRPEERSAPSVARGVLASKRWPVARQAGR